MSSGWNPRGGGPKNWTAAVGPQHIRTRGKTRSAVGTPEKGIAPEGLASWIWVKRKKGALGGAFFEECSMSLGEKKTLSKAFREALGGKGESASSRGPRC